MLMQTKSVERIDQAFIVRVLHALIKIHQSKGTHPTQTDIEDLERLTHENNEILGGDNKVPYVRSNETFSIFNNDDLPHPEGPIMETNSPSFTSRFILSRAIVSTSSVR